MTEDLMDFSLAENESSIIKVIGVGGGGGNAVNYMYQQGIKDVDFVICNTDAQALENSQIPVKIQLGESLTEGRGAGNKPERGAQSAIENLDDVNEVLSDNTKMVFITAGMGGGTGTGAAPVIAKAAKEAGILTVGIVTIPFRFEGRVRLNQALEGINKLKENVDSLLVINNEKLSEIYGDLKLSTAFSKADDVLATAAKGIAEIITLHGYINVDFEDVKTVMTDSGVAVMGSASAEGEDRAVMAIREALTSPLLNSNDVRGARNILLNISSGGEEVTMDEVGEITDYVQEAVGDSASIIWGTGQDEALGNKVCVTIIATGFENGGITEEVEKTRSNAFRATRGSGNSAQQTKMKLNEEPEPLEEKKIILTDLKESEIDEIESIPAYKRKQKNLKEKQYRSGNVIKFTLDDE
ncbi:cell division protein FtsZ [Marinifilum sp. N1E240]|uniref:cell division protein FtsZ n=1 Tax=Marinifilum sp. N1E240 TaxID=2608082 RepID=UPI00128C7F21|nr:cell division protein FtsZ [Marinifilum sp. N1E240]MPQ48625.1 cell division protein FtsZ [Marinifilum sp. N1E240]